MVLIGAINLRWLFNVILNAVSLVTWGLSALFLSQFTATTADLSVGLFSGSVSPFFLVGIGLFLLDLVIDIVVGVPLTARPSRADSIKICIYRSPPKRKMLRGICLTIAHAYAMVKVTASVSDTVTL